MSEQLVLELEVLNGPLDGAIISLQSETDWTSAADGLLAFPWDEELGQPQARFRPGEAGWSLEGLETLHGTYLIGQDGAEKIMGFCELGEGNVLKASSTWLFIRRIG